MCMGRVFVSLGASWARCLSGRNLFPSPWMQLALPWWQSAAGFHQQSLCSEAAVLPQLPATASVTARLAVLGFPRGSTGGALLWALSSAVCNWVWLGFGSRQHRHCRELSCTGAAAVLRLNYSVLWSSLLGSRQVDQGWFAFGKLHNCKCKLHNCSSTRDNGKNTFDLLMLFHVLYVAVNFFLITLLSFLNQFNFPISLLQQWNSLFAVGELNEDTVAMNSYKNKFASQFNSFNYVLWRLV